jgi:hypothetical protein
MDVKIDKMNRRLEAEKEKHFTNGKEIAERGGILPLSKKHLF